MLLGLITGTKYSSMEDIPRQALRPLMCTSYLCLDLYGSRLPMLALYGQNMYAFTEEIPVKASKNTMSLSKAMQHLFLLIE